MDSGKLEYSDKLPTPNQLCRYDFHMLLRTHTHTQPFNGSWSGTTRVGRYQKKHSPTLTHPVHRTCFINVLHLLRSIASSVFSLHAWQSSLTTSHRVLFGLPLGLRPSASYSVHFFTLSSSFRSTCPYQIAAVTLSGNSLRQTVHTHCASVHQAAKLVAALLRVACRAQAWCKVMGAYHRVYDSCHLQADCQSPGSALEPYAR